MRGFAARPVQLLFVSVVVGLGVSPAVGAEPDAEIFRSLLTRYLAMIRTENPTPVEQVADLLTDDVVQVASDGTLHEGKAASLAMYRAGIAFVQATFAQLDTSVEIHKVRPLGRDVLVLAKGSMSGTLRSNSQPASRAIWMTTIFTRVGDQWRMSYEHSSVARSATAGPTATPGAGS